LRDTTIFIVEEPDPGAAIDAGLKLTESPFPADADSETPALKLPEATVAMVVLVDEFRFAVTLDGPAERLKSPVTGAVTVSEPVAVWVSPPPVPVVVRVYVPGVVVEGTANVAIDDPEPPAIMLGLKLTVTPAGTPEIVNPTSELNPPETVVVMVEFALLPATTAVGMDQAEIVKVGVWVVAPVSAASSPAFGLPHPVTRSYPVVAE
jgi:hypothetical protein